MSNRISRAQSKLEAAAAIINGQGMTAGDLAMIQITEAQALATIELAEQHRIANLIALMQMQGEVDENTEAIAGEAMHTLIEFIRTPATQTSGPDDYPIIRPDIADTLGINQNRNNE